MYIFEFVLNQICVLYICNIKKFICQYNFTYLQRLPITHSLHLDSNIILFSATYTTSVCMNFYTFHDITFNRIRNKYAFLRKLTCNIFTLRFESRLFRRFIPNGDFSIFISHSIFMFFPRCIREEDNKTSLFSPYACVCYEI